MLNILARGFLKVAKVIWSMFIVVIVACTIANLLIVKAADISETILARIFLWLLSFQWYQRLVLGTFGLFISFSIIAWIIVVIEENKEGGKSLKKYLRAIADKYRDLKPVGFAQQSTMLPVSVPLDDIFIQLYAVSAQPRYDIPSEQIKLLEEIRQRSDLTREQREEQIQALRVVWYSQLGRELVEPYQPPNVAIETILQQLSAEQPGAVILGTPGSGKSTTMHWFAYHMAYAYRLPWYHNWINTCLHFLKYVTRAELSWGYKIPKGLTPRQIPILIRVSDYAKAMSKPENDSLPLEKFFMEYFEAEYPNSPKLPNRLLQELQDGHCLLLLDGLDEVANDELRRQITENIFTFIAAHSSERIVDRYYNRFIITSRIVGYESSFFANYAHYTLQDLGDEQIKQFLTQWCPAIERNQITPPSKKKGLSSQQEAQIRKDSIAQRDRLLEAFQSSIGIRQLAVNPLMLTILVLLQRSEKTLPHHRIDLYQIVTRTLIDNWNQDTGRKVFLTDEIPLAEDMLGRLAFKLHSSDFLLTETTVKEIARQVMTDFYQQPPSAHKIKLLIKTLRSSSGLFVESGQGFFSFMHRTFQEYYVAMHLFSKPYDELKQFIQDHWDISVWHEPLLLLIAYKNKLGSGTERQETTELISIIENSGSLYDTILHRSLLFATRCIVDCNAWTIDHTLQHKVAYRLFDLYGTPLSSGRYTQLQKRIEQVALLWLQGQALGSSDTRPPLLEAWYNALCESSHPVRQEGAIHLLASIATNLSNCPKLVLLALIPPLIQLADLQELPCPQSIRTQFSKGFVKPRSRRVAEYAFVILRLLDSEGPAGWLHIEWLHWNKEQPNLLERLTQHSLELDYLLTPAAFHGKDEDAHWRQRIDISREWQELGHKNPYNLQMQLLHTNSAATYPYAYIFKLVLDKELASPTTPWRIVWDAFLKEEMMHGRNAMYQASLHLRLLLCQEDKQQRQKIADELTEALALPDQQQIQALLAIANMFWRDIRIPQYLQEFHEPWLRELIDMLDMREILDIHRLYLLYLQKLRERRNLRYLREQRYLLSLKKLLDLQNVRKMWEMRNIRSLFALLDLRNLLNHEKIVVFLCHMLEKGVDEMSSTILVTLYSIIATVSATEPQWQHIWMSIQRFEQQATQKQLLSRDHRLLIATIGQFIGAVEIAQIVPTSPLNQVTPEENVIEIYQLKQQNKLSGQNVIKILRSCMDTRRLSVDRQLELHAGLSLNLDTVQTATWDILSQPFTLDATAISTLLWFMDRNDAIICAAAALLAQHSKNTISQDERNQIAEKIAKALRLDISSYRPIQTADSIKLWKLDDILFEALNVLTI